MLRQNCYPDHEFCVKHPTNNYKMYCEPCQVPVCDSCLEHTSNIFVTFLFRQKKHKLIDIQEAYMKKRQEYNKMFPIIKLEALLGRHADVVFHHLKRAQTLKTLIDKNRSHVDFKHRCLRQVKCMSRHIISLQKYEQRYEQSTFSALQFLLTIKTAITHIDLRVHTCRLSMTDSIKKEDVMEVLIGTQITEGENRRVGNECQLKQMSGFDSHQFLRLGFPKEKSTMIKLQKENFILGILGDSKTLETENPDVVMDNLMKRMSKPFLYQSVLTKVRHCFHLSCVSSNLVWVSYKNHLYLEDLCNIKLDNFPVCTNRISGLCTDLECDSSLGLHTTDNDMKLIYIDENENIIIKKCNKLASQFIEKADLRWRPRCVYLTPSTGDLLVGMFKKYKKQTTRKGKVSRYNQSGQLTQTIKHTKYNYYKYPIYITENNNGDIIVSDFYGALVVTERGGKHRFFYTGNPSGPGLQPRGICTDVFSHILVCDLSTNSVHILDKNGQFLSHLLVGKIDPLSLSYDANTHMVWVGSRRSSRVHVYSYIVQPNPPKALTEKEILERNLFTKDTNQDQDQDGDYKEYLTKRHCRRTSNSVPNLDINSPVQASEKLQKLQSDVQKICERLSREQPEEKS